jgi:radical SAM protein with 4Fe4S-binding SPASM domain
MINLWEDFKSSLQLNSRYNEGVAKGFNPIDKNKYRKYNRFRPDGGKQLFCYLPYNSLTFSFSGQVFVCSYNRDVELGKYPINTIDEIWNGKEAQKLREHMSYNDLDYGCRHCKFFFDKEKFSNLRPLVFDKYYQNTAATFPQVFEFELSNECNLECQMCHGEVSSSIRKNRDNLPPIPTPYDDEFVKQLEKYIPHLKEAKFYGGEPFLIPIYYQIWDKVKELNPGLELFAITNGTHWNKKIERIVTELNFDIAISIDAIDRTKLETIRKNVVYDKLMENIRRFAAICNKKGKHLSLSFTVQKDNWEQLPLVINLCNEVNAYIYVSYLERPIQFSIAELPKDELKRIREYMDTVTLPRSTQKERHNDNCFKDFKTYLDKYIENTDEKRYHEYEFKGNQPQKTEEEKTREFQNLLPVSFAELSLWIDENYATDSTLIEKLPKEILLRQLNVLLSEYSQSDRELLHALVRQNSFEPFLMSIKEHSIEDLRKMSRESLDEYQKHLLVTT